MRLRPLYGGFLRQVQNPTSADFSAQLGMVKPRSVREQSLELMLQEMDEAGVTYRAAAENIAAGYFSVAEVMDGWMNSEGHRTNLLNTKYSRVGIGFYYSSSGYKTNWVQMFAN